MIFTLLSFYNNFLNNNSNQLHIGYHRHLRDSFYGATSNHSKQHYTYQYMSYPDYSDSNSNSTSTDHSITTSVSIRVTPLENYFVSWGILWSAFVIASIVAAWQVYREHRIFQLRRLAGKNTTVATTSKKRANLSTSSFVGSNNNNNSNNNNDTGDIEDDTNTSHNKQNINATTVGDGESVSTADLTRSMVRHVVSWMSCYVCGQFGLYR